MAHFLAQAILGASTALPRDAVVNTFHFTASTGSAADCISPIQAFYTAITPWYSPAISRGAGESYIVVYNFDDPEPREPEAADLLDLEAAVSSSSLPLETALCLSYRAAYDSGSPDARRRGRIFLGPFVAEAYGMSGVYPRPATALIDDVTAAASQLLDDMTTAGCLWSVFSRADNAVRSIVGGWVDNEFDTQRRRGRDATARTMWS